MKHDPNSLVCAVRGPITLITVGALFALNNFTPYSFGQTWPVLLIVFGLLTLLCRGTRQVVPQSGQPYSAPPSNPAPPPQASYRQSPYSQPAAGAQSGTPESSQPPSEGGTL
jgi:hypothetical protein